MSFIGKKRAISGFELKCVGGADIVSGLPYKIILSRCTYTSLAIMAVFRFTSGHPDHFVVQLFSHALEKRFEPLIMLSFPPIRVQKSTHPEKPVFIVL